MHTPLTIFIIVVCCLLCFSEQTVAFSTSPQTLLACFLLLWLRCEWCMKTRFDAMCSKVEAVVEKYKESKMVKENFELSQTVMNLSDQHTLLCEIRNGVHKSARSYKDVLSHLNGSFKSLPHSSSSPLCVQKAKEHFRKGSMSDGCIPPLSLNKDFE